MTRTSQERNHGQVDDGNEHFRRAEFAGKGLPGSYDRRGGDDVCLGGRVNGSAVEANVQD
jgi:hypothetical protein